MALPPPSARGGENDLEAEGFALWRDLGPSAPRRLATVHYTETYGSPLRSWDWAAASLTMEVPDPLLRTPHL